MTELTKEEKDFIKSKLEKTLQISQKRKENKQKLINEILDMFSNDMYSYESFVLDLCEEALKTRTQKELKNIL
jgi:hypothetical protein